MSNYTIADIDQKYVLSVYRSLSCNPVSGNFLTFEEEGIGFIYEELRRRLIRMYNTGRIGESDEVLLTEDGREILTTGDRQSASDQYSNQPIIADTIH